MPYYYAQGFTVVVSSSSSWRPITTRTPLQPPRLKLIMKAAKRRVPENSHGDAAAARGSVIGRATKEKQKSNSITDGRKRAAPSKRTPISHSTAILFPGNSRPSHVPRHKSDADPSTTDPATVLAAEMTTVIMYHKPPNVITSHVAQTHPHGAGGNRQNQHRAPQPQQQQRRMTVFEAILVQDAHTKTAQEQASKDDDGVSCNNESAMATTDNRIISVEKEERIIRGEAIMSMSPEEQHSAVAKLCGLFSPHTKIHPVGRLDADTSGLLLFTNDGGLVHHVTNPSAHWNNENHNHLGINGRKSSNTTSSMTKSYTALVMGHLNGTQLQLLRDGVDIGAKYGGVTKPAIAVEVLDHPTLKSTLVNITISEGRNRQIRRMFHSVQSGVMKLHRTRIGNLSLELLDNGNGEPEGGGGVDDDGDDRPITTTIPPSLPVLTLKEGQWRILTQKEVSEALGFEPRQVPLPLQLPSDSSILRRQRQQQPPSATHQNKRRRRR
jgi:pseudouridine synthase